MALGICTSSCFNISPKLRERCGFPDEWSLPTERDSSTNSKQKTNLREGKTTSKAKCSKPNPTWVCQWGIDPNNQFDVEHDDKPINQWIFGDIGDIIFSDPTCIIPNHPKSSQSYRSQTPL